MERKRNRQEAAHAEAATVRQEVTKDSETIKDPADAETVEYSAEDVAEKMEKGKIVEDDSMDLADALRTEAGAEPDLSGAVMAEIGHADGLPLGEAIRHEAVHMAAQSEAETVASIDTIFGNAINLGFPELQGVITVDMWRADQQRREEILDNLKKAGWVARNFSMGPQKVELRLIEQRLAKIDRLLEAGRRAKMTRSVDRDAA